MSLSVWMPASHELPTLYPLYRFVWLCQEFSQLYNTMVYMFLNIIFFQVNWAYAKCLASDTGPEKLNTEQMLGPVIHTENFQNCHSKWQHYSLNTTSNLLNRLLHHDSRIVCVICSMDSVSGSLQNSIFLLFPHNFLLHLRHDWKNFEYASTSAL